jgi:hypothetical protein
MSTHQTKKSHRSNKPPKRRTAECKLNKSVALVSPYRPKATKLARVDPTPSPLAPLSLAAHGLTLSDLANMHPEAIGDAAYLLVSGKMPLPDEMRDAEALGVARFYKGMRPTDALERLALSQLLLAHGRATWLTGVLTAQTNAQTFGVISEACERATGSFMRLMRAFSEYRQPKNPSTTVSIGQANVAHQQIVQNVRKRKGTRNENDEQTRIHEGGAVLDAQAVPAVETRGEITEGRNPKNAPVGEEHGTKKSGRESRRRNELVAPRRAVSRSHRESKAGSTDD